MAGFLLVKMKMYYNWLDFDELEDFDEEIEFLEQIETFDEIPVMDRKDWPLDSRWSIG
jgi:hypothetical protein